MQQPFMQTLEEKKKRWQWSCDDLSNNAHTRSVFPFLFVAHLTAMKQGLASTFNVHGARMNGHSSDWLPEDVCIVARSPKEAAM